MKTTFKLKYLIFSLLLSASGASFAQLGGGLGGGLGGLGGGLGGLGGGLGGLGGGTSTDTAIVIDSVLQTSTCNNSTILIFYHTTTTFSFGNTFSAQLVSLLGGAPITITPAGAGLGGLFPGLGSQIFTGTIPDNVTLGLYFVRMSSSSPAHTSANSGTPVIITQTATTPSITAACQNDSVSLTATGGVTYSWSNGDTTANTVVKKSGKYTVTITDLLGCTASNSFSVAANPILVDCQFENVKLSSSVDAQTYKWMIDTVAKSSTKSITISNQSLDIYHLVTTNPASCSSISVDPSICADSNDVYTFVPNMFTPNGDGHNDVLYVRGNNIKTMYFAVYDRWGEVLFETENPKKGWDGTYNDKDINPTILVWYLRAENHQGMKREEKGYVTLMR